jgi:hypothetical protein
MEGVPRVLSSIQQPFKEDRFNEGVAAAVVVVSAGGKIASAILTCSI